MRRVYAALGVLFAVGAFAGWWIADQIDGITDWRHQ